jgi:hypothetical protein
MAWMEDLLVLGIVAVIAYYVLTTGALDTIIKNLGGVNLGAGLVPPTGLGGGGGAISKGASCPSGTSCKPGGQKGRMECDNYPHNSYEATFCGTWSGDDMSIKLWGQKHSGSTCCWCILSVSPDGQFGMRQEGPHPQTSSKSNEGGKKAPGKPSCIKATISPGPKGAHVEGWGLVGGTWNKYLTYDGPCGYHKKSTKMMTPQQVSFRCDGSVDYKCATVKPLGGGAIQQAKEEGGGEEDEEESSYVRAYYANMFPTWSSMDRIGYH